MSANYAAGLSDYDNKGKCGMPELSETDESLTEKLVRLTELIREAKHLIVNTGAGISTSAGIPDFRGPKGVWTLEEQGKEPEMDVTFETAQPTFTHWSLKELERRGKLKDSVLDWEDDLPEHDLFMADHQSRLCDVNLCLGTSLQIKPAGDMPLLCKKKPGKGRLDKKADLVIHAPVDHVMRDLCRRLGIPTADFTEREKIGVLQCSAHGPPESYKATAKESSDPKRKNRRRRDDNGGQSGIKRSKDHQTPVSRGVPETKSKKELKLEENVPTKASSGRTTEEEKNNIIQTKTNSKEIKLDESGTSNHYVGRVEQANQIDEKIMIKSDPDVSSAGISSKTDSDQDQELVVCHHPSPVVIPSKPKPLQTTSSMGTSKESTSDDALL